MIDAEIGGRKYDKADWAGIFGSVLAGISVTELVGRQVHAQLDFWPAFGIKVAAGSAVTLALLALWLGVVRKKK